MDKAKKAVEENYAVVGVLEDLNTTLAVLEHYVPRFFRGVSQVYHGSYVFYHFIGESIFNPLIVVDGSLFFVVVVCALFFFFIHFLLSFRFRSVVLSLIYSFVYIDFIYINFVVFNSNTASESVRINRNAFKPPVSDYVKDIVRRNFSREMEFYEFCKDRLYQQYRALKLPQSKSNGASTPDAPF